MIETIIKTMEKTIELIIKLNQIKYNFIIETHPILSFIYLIPEVLKDVLEIKKIQEIIEIMKGDKND